jgi:hypothetical protein
MNPEPLDQLFRSLPREKASELFTERVMARVRARTAEAAAPRRRLALAFAALALVITTGLVGAAGWRRAQLAEQTDLAAARAEQQRLEIELQQLKEMTAELQPVFYVGSTPRYDYYIDLRTLQEGSAVAHPASYQPGSRPGI